MNTIERIFQYLSSNINIQSSTILDRMPKNLFYFVSTAIIIAGVLPIVTSIEYVFAQPYPGSPDIQQPPPPGSFPNPNGPPPQFRIPFDQPLSGPASNFSFGPIASIQNDESGQPAWLAIGNWRGNLLSFNQTTIENNTASNASSAANAVFTADFRMIMLNGSEVHSHSHVITNFELSNISSDANGTMTYTGNATISLPEGPLADVPTTIKVSGEIISIFPDPATVDEHYGDTPIYGVVGEGRGNNMGPPPSPPGPPPVT